MQSYYYFKPPHLSCPPPHQLLDVEKNPNWYGEIWLRYPADERLYPMGFGQSMKALCDLRVIMRDICAVSFASNEAPQKMHWNQVWDFKERLRAWFDALPAVLSPQDLIYPSHINLQ